MEKSLLVIGDKNNFGISVPEPAETIDVAAFYLAGFRSVNSIRCLESRLNVMANLIGFNNCHEVPWGSLRLIHFRKLIQIMSELKNENGGQIYTSSSLNSYISAIRGISEAAWSLGLMTQEETARIRQIKKFRTKRITVGRELSLEETAALLDNSSGPKISEIRDHAILAILIGTGIRRAEISSISFEGYDRRQGSLKIISKGDKQRKVYMPNEVRQALDQWIDVRGSQTEGPIFVRIRRFGVIDTKAPLTPEAVGLIVQKYTALAGITDKVTPHDLRRTFATRLIKQNVDLVAVRDLMGHASVVTTSNYDRRGEERIIENIHKVKLR